MKKNIEIFCTLGPSSLNKDFLRFANNKISLLRVNMSHTKINKLEKIIKFIRNFSTIPICIDTEGAQIRTKIKKKMYLKKNEKLTIFKNSGNFMIYPAETFIKMKKNDILNIGFDGLEVKVVKTDPKKIICKTLKEGSLEHNKGVHIVNRNIKLNFITKKDKQAIIIAKQMGVRHFALSFTNYRNDMFKFNNLLKNKNMTKIFKIETKVALKNLNEILSNGEKFLIDRGDLSKAVSAEMLPRFQKKILDTAKIKKKKIYVATNFLESMCKKKYPTLAEANDIYNTIETGARGLVLASETAIGKYPKECVIFLNKMIKNFRKNYSIY